MTPVPFGTPAPTPAAAADGAPGSARAGPAFLEQTELRVAGAHPAYGLARHSGAPAAAPPAPARGAPAQPPLARGQFMCPLLARFAPHPSPGTACEWLSALGGAGVASMLAQAAGGLFTTSLVGPGSERGALIAAKNLRTIAAPELLGAFGYAPSTLNTADELWQDERPRDWDDAAARVQEVAEAAVARRDNARTAAASLAPPLPPHAAPAGPQFAHPPQAAPTAPATPAVDASTIGAAVKAAVEGVARTRLGEVKPALASAVQKKARSVCAAEVLEPLTESALIESERALGPLSKRGGDLKSELRRTRSLDPEQAHAAAAFVTSCGARFDDTAGGVPTSVSQLRQAAIAALRDAGEVARGGPNRREIDTAGYDAVHAATDAMLCGDVEFPQFVKLFGGKTPAQAIETMGSAGAGRDGSVDARADIEKALRMWARLVARVHAPLLDLQRGPSDDFGVSEFITEAEHLSPARIMRGCGEAFKLLKRQFINFRASSAAPRPDPLGVFTGAIGVALKPLQHEQLTATVATTASIAAQIETASKTAAAQARSAAAQDNKTIANLEAKLREATRQLASTRRPRDSDNGAPRPPSPRSPSTPSPFPRPCRLDPCSAILDPARDSASPDPRPPLRDPRSPHPAPRPCSSSHAPRSPPRRPSGNSGDEGGAPVAKRLRFLGDEPQERSSRRNSPPTQRPGQQQPPQGQQQQGGQQGEPLRSWMGLAKKVQEGLKTDESLKGQSWPCMKLYLTGECALPACKNCSKNGGGRGDPPARAAALKRLGMLTKTVALSPELAKEISKGEASRA